jgi:hypothetical protein
MSLKEFWELLGSFLKYVKPKKVRLSIKFGTDEPIPKENMKLTKVLKPGFRRPFTITPDEPVDVNASGTFVAVEIVTGDSTVTIDPTSTATSIKGWLNGDGSTGDKAVRFTADGHVGAGEQSVSLDVEFTVANPDATSLTAFVEGADEPIPA